jgi:hypothetical protein
MPQGVQKISTEFIELDFGLSNSMAKFIIKKKISQLLIIEKEALEKNLHLLVLRIIV